MLGGVTGAQFWKTTLALLNIIFLAHAIGMTTSVFSTEPRQAYRNAMLAAACVFLGIPFISFLLNKSGYFNSAYIFELLTAPFSTGSAGSGPRLAATHPYWSSLLLTHAMGWGSLALASWRLPHVWQERGGTTRWRWTEFWQQWRFGSASVRTHFRQRLLDKNPFFWLTSRAHRQPVVVWIILALLAAVWLWIWFLCKKTLPGNPANWHTPVFLATVTLLHLLMKAWIASEATRHLAEQRQNGSLEMLFATTPMEASELIAGHWMTLRRQFLWPVLALVGVDICFAIANRIEIALYIGSAAVLLLADVITIGWVGMWMGLSAKPKYASGNTLFRVLILPLLASGLIEILCARDWISCLIFWVLTAGAFDIALAASAKQNLLNNLRRLASPLGESRSILEVLGGAAGKKITTWKAGLSQLIDPG